MKGVFSMPAVSGMIRAMAAEPRVHLANPKKNAEEISALLDIAQARGAQLVVFPELSLTVYTCADLFMQDTLLTAAREALAGILANYRGWRRCEIILVFDAYKVKGNPGSMEKKNGIYIVYTKEAQTADSYIERATYDLGKNHRVRVATSDNMEQVIILGHGALRISARAFEEEVAEAEGQISDLIERWNVRDFDLRRVRATATIIDKKEEKGS